MTEKPAILTETAERVLAYIDAHPGEETNVIERALNMTPSEIADAMDELFDGGFIEHIGDQ